MSLSGIKKKQIQHTSNAVLCLPTVSTLLGSLLSRTPQMSSCCHAFAGFYCLHVFCMFLLFLSVEKPVSLFPPSSIKALIEVFTFVNFLHADNLSLLPSIIPFSLFFCIFLNALAQFLEQTSRDQSPGNYQTLFTELFDTELKSTPTSWYPFHIEEVG